MSYTEHIHNTVYSKSYEDNVKWVKQQYETYGDRIVFANISPWNDVSYVASVIVKDLPKPEPKTEQVKIQL